MNKKDLLEERYQIKSTLGEGAAGVVYQCHDKNLDIDVAIKILHSTSEEKALARFQKEAKITALLNQDNIVKVLDFGSTKDGNAYLVMELCQGSSLDSLIKDDKIKSLDEKLLLLSGIAKGLKHAHGKGIIHRDIKPSNVIVAQDINGEYLPKITDFGIAKAEQEEIHLTQKGSLIGTPNYMSPEALSGLELDTRSDIYSFGCLAHELLTGKIPHPGANSIEMLKQRSEAEPPLLSPSFTEGVQKLISGCLQPKPESRYNDFSSIEDQIELCLDELNSKSTISDTGSGETDRKGSSRSKLFALTALGAIILIGSVLLMTLWSNSDKTKRPKAKSSEVKNEYSYIGKLPDLATKNYISETLEPESRLSWHKYFGEIGCQNIERIDPLVEKLEKKLQAIRFSRGAFKGSGLIHLKKFNLQGIIFDECRLNEESFKEIGQLYTLKELFLDGSKITDDESVSHLTTLKNIYLLNLAATQITDGCFESLAKFPRLVQLNIRECPEIKGDGIERLTRLSILDISKTNFKSSNIKKLANLKYLIDLNLDGLGLSDKELMPLLDMRLARLNLKGSRITDKYLKRLIQKRSLKALNLVENKSISKKAIALLKQSRPDIELVHIRRVKESFNLKELAGDKANIDFFEH